MKYKVIDFHNYNPNFWKDIVRPAIYNGNELQNHGVCRKTGQIYSFVNGRRKPLKYSDRQPKNLAMSYPCVSIKDPKVFPNHRLQNCTVNAHIIIHETLNALPIPPGVTENEWKRTPVSVRKATRGIWMVNHIDHNKKNYHPKNLEWVKGAGENAQKAKVFYENQKQSKKLEY